MEQPNKRQRIQRACDACRRKKIRCEGDSAHGSSCDTCLEFNTECTWKDVVKKRGRRKKHVDALEARLAHLESTLLQNPSPLSISSIQIHPSPSPVWRPGHAVSTSGSASAASDEESDDEKSLGPLVERMAKLELEASPWFPHLGYTSGRRLAAKVFKLKEEIHGNEHAQDAPTRDAPSSWDCLDPWEQHDYLPLTITTFDFPEPDLMRILIEAYMRHFNSFFPLLHEPTFTRAVASSLHERDRSFAHLLLLVCAHGARFSEDPRVLLPGQPRRAAGWRWFSQTQISRRDVLRAPRLYDIQAYCLAALFCGTVHYHLAWMLTGMALRMLHDVGVHRKKVYSTVPNAQEELWKRCFWMVIYAEVNVCSETGRPCAINQDDYDLDLPIECDDEYWDHPDPELRFKQPPGKPSKVSYFVHILKLKKIHLRAIRSLFPAASSLADKRWETVPEALANVDSAMNEWVDSVPKHLVWAALTPQDDASELFFEQSTRLLLLWNHLRITVHRPFVAVHQPTAASAASHAQCTHAARANARLLGICVERAGSHPSFMPQMLVVSHSAAIVLLLSLWGARRMQVRVDAERTLADIEKCLSALRACQNLFKNADHLLNDLTSLVTRSGVDLSSSWPEPRNKRPLSGDTPGTATFTPTTTDTHSPVSAVTPPTSLENATLADLSSFENSAALEPVLQGGSRLGTAWTPSMRTNPFIPAGSIPAGSSLDTLPANEPFYLPSSLPSFSLDALPDPATISDPQVQPMPMPTYDFWDDEFLSMWTRPVMGIGLGDWTGQTAEGHDVLSSNPFLRT